jgi:serine/threonine-protein kinase HipA
MHLVGLRNGLELACAAGVRAAEAFLVDAGNIQSIPSEFLVREGRALAVRRFDRDGGRHIHTEDFAQIVGAAGDRKYTIANEETVYNMIRRFTADWSGELLEAVRRTVVNVMLGNGDAHLKNCSLMYRTGGAALTPAYDIVPTFLYADSALALPFGGTRDAARITLRRFERAGGLVKVSPVLQVIETILDVWPRKMEELPLPPGMREGILARWETLAIVDEVRGRSNHSRRGLLILVSSARAIPAVCRSTGRCSWTVRISGCDENRGEHVLQGVLLLTLEDQRCTIRLWDCPSVGSFFIDQAYPA